MLFAALPARSEEGLHYSKALPKLSDCFSTFMEPYKKSFEFLVHSYFSGGKKFENIKEKLERRHNVQVKFADSTVMSSRTIQFKLSNDIYFAIYIAIGRNSQDFVVASDSIQKGFCSADFDDSGKLISANGDIYSAPSKRMKALHYNSNADLKQVDYYQDEPVKSFKEIYGEGFSSPKYSVKVAIIDTGFDYNHPAIAKNIPRHLEEGAWKISGYDFEDQDDLPFDIAVESGPNHGTGVASLVVKDAPFIELILIRHAINQPLAPAIKKARDLGARIINLSLGVKTDHPDARLRAYLIGLENEMRNSKDILFVTAAGNEAVDIVKEKMAPAYYDLSNQIVVGSLNAEGKISYFAPGSGSNFNSDLVQVFVRGEDIKVATPGGLYDIASGTSFAAPQITCLAAKIASKNPQLHPEEIKKIILQKVKKS